MPNLKTSIKDLRQNERRKLNNDRLRGRIKRSVKKHHTLVTQSNVAETEKNLKNIYRVLDKAAKKNVIKKGKADRMKSRLTKHLNKLSQNNVEASKKST